MSTPIGSSQWMYATGAEVTQQSLKFNDDESQYLSWTPAAAGNRKTWTWSGWVKRGNLGGTKMLFTSYDGTNGTELRYISDGGASGVPESFQLSSFAGGYYQKTLPVHRDPSAWGQLVVSVDTTQATASDRVKIYFNGVQLANDGATNIPQNYDTHINNNIKHTIGNRAQNNTLYFDGYLSDIHFIDGQALDPTSFGQFTNGYWEAIDYAGTYGTNGFHLTFADDVVSEGFNTVTYTGNGGTQSISGLGFEPDFVWLKSRSHVYHHCLYDTIRGAGNVLYSSLNYAEGSYVGLSSFDGDGFSVGTANGTNLSGATHVAWAWDAGSGSPVSNTDGSITSSVKSNPSYGFSIVSYAGSLSATGTATVGHGLSSAPEMIIFKGRDTASNWWTYHTSLTNQNYLVKLNSTDAEADKSSNGSMSAPTSTVFDTNYTSGINTSGDNHIAYCFSSVAGYSSIGSYSGTGASGNAVTGLGFKPAFLMVKRTDSTSNWAMYDNTRSTTNPRRKNVWANLSDFEYDNSAYDIDFDADGFTLQTSDSQRNASGGTFIYMAFADTREAAFWKDVSGQGNHWTPNNLDYRDSLIDSPANNFAVLNAVDKFGSQAVLKEGNLQFTKSTATGYYNTVTGTVGMPSGKWYWEVYMASSADAVIGVTTDPSANDAVVGGSTSTSWVYQNYDGQKRTNNSSSAYGATWTTGDIIGVALDMDSGTLEFYKNGASQGQAFTGITGTALPSLADAGNTLTSVIANFGQDSTFAGARPAGGNQDDNGIGDFAYAPPSGYLALCTANLPTPTIVDGSEYFNTVLWTGDGTTDKSKIINVGFQSDFIWQKPRSSADSHSLVDSVRGFNLVMNSNGTSAEVDRPLRIADVDATSFAVADAASNANGVSNVGWSWKAGGTAVSNTDGSITSQVSANVDAGFSVVSYTGTGANATVGHGLSVIPKMVIVKRRDTTGDWPVWNQNVAATGSDRVLFLNTTDAQTAAATNFNSSSPTVSIINVGTNPATNASGGTYIAYCFSEVEGFSKVGSYTGNGSSDGPFVFTGGRVQWLMIKRTDVANDWIIWDDKRDTYNELTKFLYPNAAYAEASGTGVADFLSNGFKLRGTTANRNASGGTYIYLAIMESPLKFATAR